MTKKALQLAAAIVIFVFWRAITRKSEPLPRGTDRPEASAGNIDRAVRFAQRRDASGVLAGITFGGGITFAAQAITMRGSMTSSGFFAMSFALLGLSMLFYSNIGFGPRRRYLWFAAGAFAGMIFSILEGAGVL